MMSKNISGHFNRREVIAGAVLASVPIICAAEPKIYASTFSNTSGTLRDRAERKGLLVGTTLDYAQFSDDDYIAAISRDSNVLVPENGFNWTRTQPHEVDQLDFSQVEPVYNLANKIGAKMRLHDLVYDLTTPKWVKELVPSLSKVDAERLLVNYINNVLRAWGSKVAHVEVVNEPGYALTKDYRPFVFSEKLGMAYLDIAYHAAHAAAPNALLFTNAAVLEPDNRIASVYRSGMLKLLEGMLKRHVPIHAVGIEAHLLTEYPFSQKIMGEFFKDLTSLGLKFMVTEMDVNDRGIVGGIAARDAGAAALGKAFLDVAFSFEQCIGLITWNGSDRYTWLHSNTDEGDAPVKRQRSDRQMLRPTPLDDHLKRKPLWSAIAAALDAAPKR